MTTSGAVLRNRIGDPIDFTVADGTGIEKGAILELTDPRTAIAHTATTAGTILAPTAGIAAREKVASDGRTQLACFRSGIFDCSASGAILVGAAVVAVEDNFVRQAVHLSANGASGAIIIGTALETATDFEMVQIQLNLQ